MVFGLLAIVESFMVFDMVIHGPVSYTHLDVYKRQGLNINPIAQVCPFGHFV